jgi:hypothetical protein
MSKGCSTKSNVGHLKYRAIEKKIERAVINTLQLATRKNLTQTSSTVIINYCLLQFAITICSL